MAGGRRESANEGEEVMSSKAPSLLKLLGDAAWIGARTYALVNKAV